MNILDVDSLMKTLGLMLNSCNCLNLEISSVLFLNLRRYFFGTVLNGEKSCADLLSVILRDAVHLCNNKSLKN